MIPQVVRKKTDTIEEPFMKRERRTWGISPSKRWLEANRLKAVFSVLKGEPVLPINHNIDDVSVCPESLHLRFRSAGREPISPAELGAYRAHAAPNTCGCRSVSVETAARCYHEQRRRWRRSRSYITSPLIVFSGTMDDQLRILGSRRPATPNLSLRSPYNNLIGRCIVVANFFRHDLSRNGRHAARFRELRLKGNHATLFFHPVFKSISC